MLLHWKMSNLTNMSFYWKNWDYELWTCNIFLKVASLSAHWSRSPDKTSKLKTVHRIEFQDIRRWCTFSQFPFRLRATFKIVVTVNPISVVQFWTSDPSFLNWAKSRILITLSMSPTKSIKPNALLPPRWITGIA